MSKESMPPETGELSRRHFLVGAGKLFVGAAVGAAGLSTVACGQATQQAPKAAAAAAPTAAATTAPAATASAAPTAMPVAASSAPTIPAWPWPYTKLDPQEVAQAAYDGFYKGACMYGAFNAIVGTLQKQVGYPFTMIPTDMSRYGEGGVAGWATLCGALNGSSAAINLVTKDYSPVVDELMSWYSTTALPTFTPANPKVKISATSVSDSPLCHVSVTEWCKASGAKSESPERAERCARVAASVASHAVELLNTKLAGGTIPAATLAASVKTCGACHLKGGTIENARGKMDCVQCHTPKELKSDPAHPPVQ